MALKRSLLLAILAGLLGQSACSAEPVDDTPRTSATLTSTASSSAAPQVSDAPETDAGIEDRSIISLERTCTPRPSVRIREKVVGGDRADIRHWPGLAVLRTRAPGGFSSKFFCGGTVINSECTVFAANCFGRTQGDECLHYYYKAANGQ